MNTAALIFVGLNFTFKSISGSQQKVLHMVNFLRSKKVRLSEEKIEDIFHDLKEKRENYGLRYGLTNTSKVQEFEEQSGLAEYFEREGHKYCRAY